MSVPKPRPLSDSEWDRQQWIIREFELAWRRHEDPPIDRYLTLSLLENERLLIELAHVDLEFRIKAGLAPRVEDYLRRYPVLTRNRAWVVDLIRHEYRFRSRGERELKFASFRDRFPEYLDDFPTPDPSAGWSAASEVDKPGSDRNADLALPRDVGNFELRERLGVGSFGVVYRAFDRLARRDVVVKVPKSTVLTSQADIRSFAREARNSIDLKHPNIVSVHAIIQFDEMICLVREFVEGQTLAERLLESLYTPMDAARLMIVIARAVDYANQSGIIHRDLKPSNILIDRQGVPHVSDFGLARSEHGDTTLSPSVQSHVTIGTMEYMAPEQARGEGFLADARSDVFSLGTIFYQLLTNSLPFQGRNQMLLVQIQETEPKAPHCLNEEVPDGLEAICLKALAKNPAHRYQSAGLMAEDLQAFLENGPIQALPLADRRLPKKPLASAPRRVFANLVIASLLLTAVGTTWLWIGERTRRQRNSQAIAAIYQGVLELAAGAGKGGTRAWDLARDQVEILERDPDLVELAADARLRLARRAEAEGADRRAEIAWQHAIEAAEVSLRAHPGQPARMEDLAEALAKLGMIRVRAGQDFQANAQSLFDRSIRHGAEARQIRKLRLETHPTEIDARLDLAESIVRSSVHQTSLIAPADLDAVEWVVLDWSRGWMSCTPEQKRRLAGINLTLTAWQRAIGQSGPAERSALMALRLLKEPSASRLDKFILARAHLARGLALADFHESQAILVLEEAARRLDGFALEDPDAAEELRLLGQAVFEVGRLRMREGSREKGVASYRRSLAVRITLDRRFPGAHAHAAELAQTRAALARGLEGRPWESLRHSFQAFTDQARAVGLAPGEPRHREDLGRFTQALVSDLWVVLTRARLAASPESPPLEKISPSTRQPVAGSP